MMQMNAVTVQLQQLRKLESMQQVTPMTSMN